MEDKNKKVNVNHYAYGMASVLRKKVVFTELRFYQRSEVLFAHHWLFEIRGGAPKK